jgi:hypothetical protein
LAQYVKFLRGSPAAYNNLAVKDIDTLYFIYEEDESTGLLYLGSKLIAGSETGEDIVGGVEYLSKLKDVLISENLLDTSFLVYDNDAAAWVNKSLDQLLFVGATNKSKGIAGLVPEPKAGQDSLFLRGDGFWAAPTINHTILTLENTDKSSHNDLITKATEDLIPISGDIVIVKDLIANNKWQYTSYVFDDSQWHAMDGNYDAENVYFSEDLITTTAVGNIELTDGQAVIAAAGKKLKQVFETIFVQERDPKVIDPEITLTFT